jgi:hypothetical protein
MTKSYSLDLRKRVARFVEAGHSCHEAARHFEVSVAFVVRLMAAYRATGSLAPKPEEAGATPSLIRTGSSCSNVWPRRATSPCRNLPQNSWPSARRSRPLRSRTGSAAKGYRFKKTLRASEQGRSDVRQAREHWRTKRQPRMRQEPHRLVFLDETGTSTKMTRLRGRCPKGQRLYAKAPFGHWLTQTFVAGLRCYGLTAPWVIDGPMTRPIFETYVETQLAPTLSKGDVVILDNLPAHKSEKAAQCLSKEEPGFCSCPLTVPI